MNMRVLSSIVIVFLRRVLILLDKQFCERTFAVVGMHETRLQFQGEMSSENYCIISCPADAKGVGGVQLWIARHLKHILICISAVSNQIMLVPVVIKQCEWTFRHLACSV